MAFLTGLPEQTKQFQRFTGQQQGIQNQILGQLQGMLQPGQMGSFAPIEQQARKNFSTQTIPGLAERFTSLGGQRSSAFQGALGQAGSDLESNLATLRGQYDQNQLNNLLPYAFTPSFESGYQPEAPGFLESAGQGITEQAIKHGIPILLNYLFPGSGNALSGGTGSADIQRLIQLLSAR